MTIPIFPLRPSLPLAHLSTRIQGVIQQALDTHRLVGAVVLVACGGELIHQQAAGWADRECARPMELGTISRLASVSKPIVSAAALALVLVLVLVAQGQIGLDDEISRWLPEFQPRLADGSYSAANHLIPKGKIFNTLKNHTNENYLIPIAVLM